MGDFWLKDWCQLFSSYDILPLKRMSVNEKLNSFTRLVLLTTLVLYIMDQKYWLYILIGGLAVVFAIKCASEQKREGFSLNPTYAEGSTPMTTVPPLFAEEWQIPPPAYDTYSWEGVISPSSERACESQSQLKDYSYPIVNEYITDSTLLPFEEETIKNRPLKDVGMYMSDAYSRDQMDFRNDMTKIYNNKINREYKHGCNQNITPFNSW